jgi:hypothetical protein
LKYRPDDRLVRVDEQIRTTGRLNRAEQKTSVEEATDLNPLRQTLETALSRASGSGGARARRDTLAGSWAIPCLVKEA